MPKVRLTDAAVQRYRAPMGARVEYFDVLLPGFALRVAGPTKRTPEGRKTWVLFYRYDGVQKRLTLPLPYPALALADARRQAAEALKQLSEGIDPAARRLAALEKTSPRKDTIRDLSDRYLTDGMKGRKGTPLSERYKDETRRNLQNHVLPTWGDRDPASISRKDVISLLDGIATPLRPTGKVDRAGRPKGGPIAANRVLSAIRAMFNWAVRRDDVDLNPCALVQPPGHEIKGRRRLSQAEIIEAWGAFDELSYPFGTLFGLLLATAQRRTAVAGMQWMELDLVERVWVVPASRTKRGDHDHLVPLSSLAIEILRKVPRKTRMADGESSPSRFVLTTNGTVPVSGFSKAKCDLDKIWAVCRAKSGLGPVEAWRLHDLRRTAATEMGRLGVPGVIIGETLNHTRKGITDTVYNLWEYLPEKRVAMETWGDALSALTARQHGI